MIVQTILWHRLDLPGHEAARLESTDSHWHLHGTAVFAHRRGTCCVEYAVRCDAQWKTCSGTVRGWVGREPVAVEIAADRDGRWFLDGVECPGVHGCIDLDYEFSPSTNLLPIRRTSLAVGTSAAVRAAWLRFPELRLEPLDQIYRRLGPHSYRYESTGGRFVRDLDVDDHGMVTRYPDFWDAESPG